MIGELWWWERKLRNITMIRKQNLYIVDKIKCIIQNKRKDIKNMEGMYYDENKKINYGK